MEPVLNVMFDNGVYVIGQFYVGKGFAVYDRRLPATDTAEPGQFIKGFETFNEALSFVDEKSD